MCVTLITRTLPDSRSSPRDRVCARFEGDLSWVFKAEEEVCGERYWLIFMGTVGDGDFWLFDWRICLKM